MSEKTTGYIELAGQKHPVRLTLRAIKELNARFGDLKNLGQILSDSSNMDALLDALNDTLKILMKAGRCYESLMGTELPPKLPCDPIDVMDADATKAVGIVLATMRGDTERQVETEPKNAEATQDSKAPRGSTTTDSEPE